jgi:hypothetical protein
LAAVRAASEFFVLIHELERESIGRAGRTCVDIMAEMGR